MKKSEHACISRVEHSLHPLDETHAHLPSPKQQSQRAVIAVTLFLSATGISLEKSHHLCSQVTDPALPQPQQSSL